MSATTTAPITLWPTICYKCLQLMSTPGERAAHAARHYKVTFSATSNPPADS